MFLTTAVPSGRATLVPLLPALSRSVVEHLGLRGDSSDAPALELRPEALGFDVVCACGYVVLSAPRKCSWLTNEDTSLLGNYNMQTWVTLTGATKWAFRLDGLITRACT